MPKLFMLLIGCTPDGRHTEQHDIYFGIGEHIKDLFPGIIAFWPEAKGQLHIDAWREVNLVNGYRVTVNDYKIENSEAQLFFLNLGGYKKGEFEEFHYKMIVAAPDKGEAVKMSKRTAFFKHTGFKGANAHIDDRYGVDVDDIHAIRDILPAYAKSTYNISLQIDNENTPEDEINLGYFRMDNVYKWAP